jgi:hypothetical protein
MHQTPRPIDCDRSRASDELDAGGSKHPGLDDRLCLRRGQTREHRLGKGWLFVRISVFLAKHHHAARASRSLSE